jgi:nicotinamide-nucleotide amidase
MPQIDTFPAKVSLLSIGDELLLGEITDTNMPHIARSLLPLGLAVIGCETVGDEMSDIVAAFQRALARADIVMATGGLGPTDDDLTMAALAKALGVELEFYPVVMEQMAERLKRPLSASTAGNRKQAFLPKGAHVLRNDWGTAPGVHVTIPSILPAGTDSQFPNCRKLVSVPAGGKSVSVPAGGKSVSVPAGEKHVFLMPGVPREMKGLLNARILPILAQRFPAPQAIVIKTLHSFGIPESVVGERIKDLMQAGRNPNVGTRVGGGVVSVRLVATAATQEEARALLATPVEKVREALREGFFGEDDENALAQAALKALLARRRTAAVAESCTGGLVAARLTDIPGSSAAFLEGAVVYSNTAKTRACGVKPETIAAHGAVSAPTAHELAAGIRARAGADIGVAVTGIAGPDGATPGKPVGLVFFGVATAKGVQTYERNYPGYDRQTVRDRAAAQALDFLRRAALEE